VSRLLRLRVLVGLVIVVGCGALSPTAGAAVTLGQTFAPSSGPNGYTQLQAQSPPGVSYAAPSDGVITQWGFWAGSGGASSVKVKVGRGTGAGPYLIVGESALQNPATGQLNTYATRISVRAGDFIGLYAGTGFTLQGSGGQFGSAYTNADVAPGNSYTSAPGSTSQIDVSARLEPDVDGDGFGDESQDLCPTDPSTAAACQADLSVTKASDKAIASPGDAITYTIAIKNNSPNTAKTVSVSDALPSGVTLVSATPSAGSCSQTSCALGDLAGGAAATVAIVVRAVSPGSATDIATVASQTPDPNPVNNSASATTTIQGPSDAAPVPGPAITAPFAGVRVADLSMVVDKRGRVTVTVGCPAASVGSCVGSDKLTTVGKVTVAAGKRRHASVLTLGTSNFSIAAGQTQRVTITLSKTARRLLTRKHTLRARQTAVAEDSRGNSKTTTASATLKSR
jgi:uncharacterized repeat protein (TIGR01451 family)